MLYSVNRLFFEVAIGVEYSGIEVPNYNRLCLCKMKQELMNQTFWKLAVYIPIGI